MFASWSTKIMSTVVLIRYQGEQLDCPYINIMLFSIGTRLQMAYAYMKFTAYLKKSLFE